MYICNTNAVQTVDDAIVCSSLYDLFSLRIKNGSNYVFCCDEELIRLLCAIKDNKSSGFNSVTFVADNDDLFTRSLVFPNKCISPDELFVLLSNNNQDGSSVNESIDEKSARANDDPLASQDASRWEVDDDFYEE